MFQIRYLEDYAISIQIFPITCFHYINRQSMSIHVAIRHQTKYIYDRNVKLWPQTIRLRPAPHSRTKILSYTLNIHPANHFINWMQDPFGNFQARVSFPEQTKEFRIDVEVQADMISINPFDFFLDDYAEVFPFTYLPHLEKELQPYLEIMESGPLLSELIRECRNLENQNTVDFLVSINQKIYNRIQYTIRMEAGVQTCEKTLEKKLGSCRDSAWLLVQLLRSFGLAARFVSGYLVQLKADVKAIDGPSGPEEDFTDLHAWAEVFIPGAGWIGLDATSGLFSGEGHIPLACTPHFESAAPVSGMTSQAKVQFEFFNSVERIYESPRVTKPYSKAQWEKILAVGHQVDEMLKIGGVKLTMGGEPTFISNTDMESDQWNSAADGKDKRKLAFKFTQKLQNHFASNGFLHLGQGKWYPGEPIPRWQYAIFWNKKKQPLWSHQGLFADPNTKGKNADNVAQEFLENASINLGINPENVITAYEDKYYYLWEKNNLPFDFDDDKNSEKTSIERKTLLELLEKGLENPSGYVLPVRWEYSKKSWISCHWRFRRKKLFLIPGNSQLGLRLPLNRIDSLSSEDDVVLPPNHFEGVSPLPERSEIEDRILQRTENSKDNESFDKVPPFKTALCTQVVDGNLHLFLPPIEDPGVFYDLIQTIEFTSKKMDLPIILEGYQPPFHPDISTLVVTPDPGVIEVNIHPAHSWQELLEVYEVLFSSAENTGLGTNKYMLDGIHSGTGGGNHITLGGVTPAESPLLRKPDLLRSFVNFWQNHPSLSYLFSSRFVGPTSQAPRVDEGRANILYELDIAFRELERFTDPPFWIVDRIFRNLLTDITGNTHRAEFCIDKLYSPDSTSGRLGILELRGFDMPPHKEMCLVQLLLIRSLTAAFWRNPYKNKLINWGTDLHDRFMLHQFVKEDISEVIDYLNHSGISFDKSWFDVFLEFRFPIHGTVTIEGIHMTLRAAIEPWIVLGEEMSNSGTSRYVDSSVEKLEILVEDFNPERYLVLCNSIKVPLIKTSYSGKYVAAVKYKAWAPPSALHPTIGINSPLVFDIYDTWNDRSIGGCTYHVIHPGGRNYETFPVNNLEAESRRATRFWDFNHSPQNISRNIFQDQTKNANYVTTNKEVKEEMDIKEVPVSKDFPHTLDLRRT